MAQVGDPYYLVLINKPVSSIRNKSVRESYAFRLAIQFGEKRVEILILETKRKRDEGFIVRNKLLYAIDVCLAEICMW